MRYIYILYIALICFTSCKTNQKAQENYNKPYSKSFTSVLIKKLSIDTTSIRVLEIKGNHTAYAGSNGHYGILQFNLTKAGNGLGDIMIMERTDNMVTFLN